MSLPTNSTTNPPSAPLSAHPSTLPSPPSPSPPPNPPIPLTPGPRASLFTSLFANALAHTLRTCSYANFSACFPTPATHAPNILRAVWTQIVQGIETRARREFEDILVERDVVAGLNELERLVGEARGRRDRGEGKGEGVEAPHTLPPERLYLAHLAPYLTETEKELQAELARTQTENEELALGIQRQREEVEMLIAGLEQVVRDVEGANGVMDQVVEGGDEEGGLGREVREMEEEVRGKGARL